MRIMFDFFIFFDFYSERSVTLVADSPVRQTLFISSHRLPFWSAGHDSGVRLWNLETKTCFQEITAHRKKFDESIFDVAFHPSRPYIARCALNIVID